MASSLPMEEAGADSATDKETEAQRGQEASPGATPREAAGLVMRMQEPFTSAVPVVWPVCPRLESLGVT